MGNETFQWDGLSSSPTVIQSLPKTALLSHSSEIQKMSFVPFLFSNKAPGYTHFFAILLPNNSICNMYD